MTKDPWEWAKRVLRQADKREGYNFSLNERELTAVLLGPTQAGKTSLALLLLGVKDPRIYKALRGETHRRERYPKWGGVCLHRKR